MNDIDTTSSALWEAAYLYSTDALFVAEADGALSQWSEPFGRLLGSAAVRGAQLSHLFHQDDRQAFEQVWNRLNEAAGPYELRGRVLTSEGAYTSYSCVLRRAPRGRSVYGVLRPASDGSHAGARNDERGEIAEILQVLSENLPVVIWAIDRNGIFTHYDGKGLDAAGVKRGQFVGKNLFEVYSYKSEETTQVTQALQGEHLHSLTEVHGVFWENWVVPIQDTHGKVKAVVGLSLDISEAKKAEQELRARLEQIQKQQEVISKLSSPIIQVWDGVLALPVIGVVDSARTAEVMQNLLDAIVRTGAHYAILDLTGVEVVDTQVASHLIRLVSAIRLLGADGIICGIRPPVAQTIVTLGLDISGVVTRSNLKAGITFCIEQMRRLHGAAASTGHDGL